MSGGIYEGPNGELLHGDGKLVRLACQSDTCYTDTPMWPFRTRPIPPKHALERRVDALEDDIAHLRSRLNKLRGWLTGAARQDNDDEQDVEDEVLDMIQRRTGAR